MPVSRTLANGQGSAGADAEFTDELTSCPAVKVKCRSRAGWLATKQPSPAPGVEAGLDYHGKHGTGRGRACFPKQQPRGNSEVPENFTLISCRIRNHMRLRAPASLGPVREASVAQRTNKCRSCRFKSGSMRFRHRRAFGSVKTLDSRAALGHTIGGELPRLSCRTNSAGLIALCCRPRRGVRATQQLPHDSVEH
jgi:hypothetical protein